MYNILAGAGTLRGRDVEEGFFYVISAFYLFFFGRII